MSSSLRLRFAFACALTTVGVYAFACADSGGAGDGQGSDGDGGGAILPEAGVGASDADAPGTTMRLAHAAADLGPVDFCYRTATSTSFVGPVLGGGLGDPQRDSGAAEAGVTDATIDHEDATVDDAASGDGGGGDAGAVSVGYRTVSRYLNLSASGPLTISLVAPGAASCASPLFIADVTLDPGKLATVAIVGSASSDAGAGARAILAFVDDRTTTPDKARVRMINAAFGSSAAPVVPAALAVRAVSAQALALADRVEPSKAGSPSATVPIDSLGYATVDALPSPAELAVGPVAGTAADAAVDAWVSSAGELGLRGGSLHTGFILTGESGRPFEILWCLDTSTSGDSTTCDVVR